MNGIGARILGGNIQEEMEKRVRTVTEALIPKINEMIQEQKKTNDLLEKILAEIKKLHRKK